MTFDEHGYLMPYGLIPTNLNTIETVFVEPFYDSKTRRKIAKAFSDYLTELRSALNVPLEIWVNGSFTTRKRDPNDIDFVIFVSKQVATNHNDIIYQFRKRRYTKNSVTDGYFVEVVAADHPDYNLYQLDREDWHRTFSFSRHGQKGYLQLMV